MNGINAPYFITMSIAMIIGNLRSREVIRNEGGRFFLEFKWGR